MKMYYGHLLHMISLILEFINDEIESIDVQATKILNNNIEDTTLTLLNFKNNIKTHIFVSWIHPFKEQRFVIVEAMALWFFQILKK